MFKKLQDFFGGSSPLKASLQQDKEGKATERDLHIAAAVMLVEMAGADEAIDPREAQAVCEVMSNQFGLQEGELPELIEVAVAARKEQGKIDQFVDLINEKLGVPQKQRLLAMIWKVVLADGQIEKFEERFATQMKFRLRLTNEQADAARQMVENGLV